MSLPIYSVHGPDDIWRQTSLMIKSLKKKKKINNVMFHNITTQNKNNNTQVWMVRDRRETERSLDGPALTHMFF